MTPLEFISGQPWAILPAALEGIIALAERHPDRVREAFARLPGADPDAVSAQDGVKLNNTRTVEVRDGVAVVPVRGVLSRYSTIFHQVCGGTSYQVLAKDVRAAVDNPNVRAVLLEIDSPGGQATGVGELAAQVREAAKVKPVCAYVGGLGCSAAYWLASAATEVVCHPTATLGSIGAVLSVDSSAPAGQVKFVSSQSPLKQADPTTDAGKAEIQAWVDALADEFVDTVASYRGTTRKRVMSDFGKGGVKVGRAAVAAGMADACGDFETTLSRLSRGKPLRRPAPKKTEPPAKPAGKPPTGASASMNLAKMFGWLVKNNPEAAAAAMEAEGDAPDAEFFARSIAAGLMPPKVPAPAAPEKSAEAIRAEIAAEVRRENDATLRSFYAEQAGAWFDGMVRAGKAVPATKARTVALYVDAAMSDRVGPVDLGNGETMTRLSFLTSSVEANEPNGLTAAYVAPGKNPAEVDAKLADAAVLPQASGDPDEKAKARARALGRKATLEATPEGRAYLATDAGKAFLASIG